MSDDNPRDWDTTTVTYPDLLPEVIETVDVDGVQVHVLRHVYATTAFIESGAEWRYADRYEAVRASGYTMFPAERRFYVNAGKHHAAGSPAGGNGSRVDAPTLGWSVTVAGAVTAARRTLTAEAIVEKYGNAARHSVRTLTGTEFGNLPTDATIEPGDLVATWGHNGYRQGVAVKVTKTQTHLLFSTPSGNGHLTNGRGKTGEQVRLVRKAPAAPVQPELSEDHRIDAGLRAADVNRQLDAIEAEVLAVPAVAAEPVEVPADDVVAALDVMYAAPVMEPGEVERSSGMFRNPEKFCHWSPAIKAGVLAAPRPAAGRVVLVIVYANSSVVGPFESPAAAQAWWDVEWNRLADRCKYTILPAPVEDAEPVELVEVAPAPLPPHPVDGRGCMTAEAAAQFVAGTLPRRSLVVRPGPAGGFGVFDTGTGEKVHPQAADRWLPTRRDAFAACGRLVGADMAARLDEARGIIAAELAEYEAAAAAADPDVWVSIRRKGQEYHELTPAGPEYRPTTCARSTRTGVILHRSEAIDQYGSKPCRRCYVVDGRTPPATQDPAEPTPEQVASAIDELTAPPVRVYFSDYGDRLEAYDRPADDPEAFRAGVANKAHRRDMWKGWRCEADGRSTIVLTKRAAREWLDTFAGAVVKNRQAGERRRAALVAEVTAPEPIEQPAPARCSGCSAAGDLLPDGKCPPCSLGTVALVIDDVEVPARRPIGAGPKYEPRPYQVAPGQWAVAFYALTTKQGDFFQAEFPHYWGTNGDQHGIWRASLDGTVAGGAYLFGDADTARAAFAEAYPPDQPFLPRWVEVPSRDLRRHRDGHRRSSPADADTRGTVDDQVDPPSPAAAPSRAGTAHLVDQGDRIEAYDRPADQPGRFRLGYAMHYRRYWLVNVAGAGAVSTRSREVARARLAELRPAIGQGVSPAWRLCARSLELPGGASATCDKPSGHDDIQIARGLLDLVHYCEARDVEWVDGEFGPHCGVTTPGMTGCCAQRVPCPTHPPVGVTVPTAPAGGAEAPPPDGGHTPAGWPIVEVSQADGPPVRAELRERNPNGRTVKVVYLHSRTGAWVATGRVTETVSAG